MNLIEDPERFQEDLTKTLEAEGLEWSEIERIVRCLDWHTGYGHFHPESSLNFVDRYHNGVAGYGGTDLAVTFKLLLRLLKERKK